MSADIERREGKWKFVFANEPGWHGLGVEESDEMSFADVAAKHGLAGDVEGVSLVTADTGIAIPMAKAVRRVADGKILAVNHVAYGILQDRKVVDAMDRIRATGALKFETMGHLRGGRKFFALGRFTTEPAEVVPGDVIYPYLLGSNSHDGSRAGTLAFTRIRAVCANTEGAALNIDDEANGGQVTARVRVFHCGEVAESFDQLAELVDWQRRAFTASIDQYRALAKKNISQADVKKVVKLAFRPKSTKKQAAQQILPAVDVSATVDRLFGMVDLPASAMPAPQQEEAGAEILEKVTEYVECGRGTEIPGVRGTGWGLYNAVSEYVEHARGRDPEIRLDQAWFGQGSAIMQRALRATAAL